MRTKISLKKVVVSSLLVGSLLSPVIACATNGLFGLGYGARQVGIAGSGVAFPQDPLIAAINPAGVVYLGEEMELDIQYFSPEREYTIGGATPATVESDSEHFFIPSFGISHPLNDVSSVGLAVYGNGGMNTDYASSNTPFGAGTFGGDHTGVNYAQLFANLNYSRKFAEGKASWGIAAILNYSYIRMNGLSGFAGFSVDPSALTNEGYDGDFGIGVRVGVMGEVLPGFTLAASYQTKIKNTFDDYKGLFANGGELDIPAVAQIGLAAELGVGTLTFDIQRMYYSDADAIGNTSRTLLTGGQLGGVVGFGWDDMTVYKLGYTWETNNGWTWRVGASYGDQPIPDEEVTFSILATGVIEKHYTAGFTKTLSGGDEVSVALMYAPRECVSGNHLLAPTTVEICMKQFSVNAGYSF